jgi:TolA-binding protein
MRLPLIPRFILLGVLACAAPLPHPARAQMDSREFLTLRNQIDQLRHDLQVLQDQTGRGGGGGGSGSYLGRGGYPAPQALQPGGNDLLAQLLTRVDALEDQVRQLRGRIDETQNQVQRQGADLGKRIDDLAFQVTPQGNAGGASQAGTGPRSEPEGQGAPPPPKPPRAAPQPRTPETAMQEGNAALARRDYAAAEQSAREVLANRASPRAYDAQLLLAQALSGERQYAQAAIAYDDAYNRSKKGTHAQEALLGLANALTSINEKKAACDTLVRLRTEFPQPRTDLRDGISAANQRAGCK